MSRAKLTAFLEAASLIEAFCEETEHDLEEKEDVRFGDGPRQTKAVLHALREIATELYARERRMRERSGEQPY